MSLIPKNHPRTKSLLIREKLVEGFDHGLVAKEGLLAHGRGEAFDYLIGEKTSTLAKNAIKVASAALLSAQNPVISVNGNIAALCPAEIIQLSKVTGAKIEVNLFYANQKRKNAIRAILKKNGVSQILGFEKKYSTRISNLDSARRIVDKRGIYLADVVLVPLEDGDRTLALKKAGKCVITFDLNPLSRTAQTADITIVDNVTRAMRILIDSCKSQSKKDVQVLKKIVKSFDNKKNLSSNIIQIRDHLTRKARNA